MKTIELNGHTVPTQHLTLGGCLIRMWAEPGADGWREHIMIEEWPGRELFRFTTGPYASREIAEEAIKRQMRGEA